MSSSLSRGRGGDHDRGGAPLLALMVGSALGGVALTLCWQAAFPAGSKKSSRKDPETDFSVGHEIVWNNIRGAIGAAMIYVGDRLDLYATLRAMCSDAGDGDDSSDSTSTASVTAIQLAQETGLNQRWLREWLAQQAAMGVLTLLPGSGDADSDLHYRLPKATGSVLADPDSSEYDVSMVHAVPSLVHRAKTMIPEAMRTGIGLAYNEPEVATAIDRQHTRHIRHVFIPKVLSHPALDGRILSMLERGCHVCDLGCGAGSMLIALAVRFPKSTFHGFEISAVALQKASYASVSQKLTNVTWHDANETGHSLGDFPDQFDLAIVYDVLHDSTRPADLIAQVRTALKPNTGVWLLADIPAKESVRANLSTSDLKAPDAYLGFSLCLCMSCGLSEPGGAGLGSLGFSIPVARKMLKEGGFDHVKVLLEEDNARWFWVQ